MKKAGAKKRFGKGLIIVIVLSVLTVLAGVSSVILLSHNTSIVQLFGGNDNVYESARLEKLTINGFTINSKLTDEIKAYKTIDAEFDYYYHDVAFWDKNGENAGIAFYTFSNKDGNQVTSIEQSKIEYEDRRLKTLDDFEETFGLGEHTEEGDSKVINYYQGEYKLTIQSRDGVVYSVILLRQE